MKKSLVITSLLILTVLVLVSWHNSENRLNYRTAKSVADTTICDKVFGGKFLDNSQITFLNLGGVYPNQKISVVIKGKNRDKFKDAPEKLFDGKTICVTGQVTLYKGKPEIVVSDPKQIAIRP